MQWSVKGAFTKIKNLKGNLRTLDQQFSIVVILISCYGLGLKNPVISLAISGLGDNIVNSLHCFNFQSPHTHSTRELVKVLKKMPRRLQLSCSDQSDCDGTEQANLSVGSI